MTVRRQYTYLLVLLITGLMIVSCSHVDDSIYDPEFNVYGILYSWKPRHEIIVDRTYRMNEPSEPYVNDATVILSTGGFRDTLIYDNTLQRYSSGYHELQPSTTYDLFVSKDGIDTLRGSTTVPGDFVIVNMIMDTLALMDSIRFTHSQGAAMYELTIREPLTSTEYSFWYFPDPEDTLTTVLGNYIYNIPSSVYEILITALDSNYRDYYFEPLDSLYAAGVTGGVGLFSSSWTVSKQFYIITE